MTRRANELTRDEVAELWNLYHLARTALAGREKHGGTRYERKVWAAGEFAKTHPDVSSTAAYLAFELEHEAARAAIRRQVADL